MKHGQLFGGIFGFGLAAQWAGIENVWYNEIDKYCCDVVRARMGDGSIKDKVKIYEQDIREIGKHNLSPVDIITGGFPCQPFSHAGKRKGKEDPRFLWPQMLRIISELMPPFVIGENVAGLKSMENGKTLEGILIDLEDIGYQVETFLVPACGVGAWHRRDRIWIIAYSDSNRRFELREEGEIQTRGNTTNNGSKDVPNTERQGFQESQVKEQQKGTSGTRLKCGNLQTGRETGNWSTEPQLGRVANGIPSRVDRLKGLGNAIVPQVAFELFKAIKQ